MFPYFIPSIVERFMLNISFALLFFLITVIFLELFFCPIPPALAITSKSVILLYVRGTTDASPFVFPLNKNTLLVLTPKTMNGST